MRPVDEYVRAQHSDHVTWTLANKITLLRLVLVPVFVFELVRYVECGLEFHRWVAFALFLLCAVLDGVDGWVARRFNQRTRIGSLLDPVADKIMVALGLVLLSMDHGPRLDRIPWWLLAIVVGREICLLAMGLSVTYLVGERAAKPSILGKAASVFQVGCVLWALLRWDLGWLEILAGVTAGLTVLSTIGYGMETVRFFRSRGTDEEMAKSDPRPGGTSGPTGK